MTTFQISALAVLALLLVTSLANLVRRRGRPGVSILWSLLWVAGAIALIRPSLTRVVANFLGIGRGADLVFYVGLITMAIGFFVVYVRIRRLRHDVTVLTRELAISRARVPQPLEAQPSEAQPSEAQLPEAQLPAPRPAKDA